MTAPEQAATPELAEVFEQLRQINARNLDEMQKMGAVAIYIEEQHAKIATLTTQRDALRAALNEVVEACRPSGKFTDWRGCIRSPNPSTDGAKFERAELLLASGWK